MNVEQKKKKPRFKKNVKEPHAPNTRVSSRIAGKSSIQATHREVYALAEMAQAEEKALMKEKRKIQAQPLNTYGCL